MSFKKIAQAAPPAPDMGGMGAPPAPDLGGMGLASLKLDNMIKTAFLLDQKGEYRKADEIFNNI